jgi:hypothetical protein
MTWITFGDGTNYEVPRFAVPSLLRANKIFLFVYLTNVYDCFKHRQKLRLLALKDSY